MKPQKGVNYYLSMASKNEKWLQYKMAELSEFFPKNSLTIDHNTYRCASCCSEDFTAIHNRMYKNGIRQVDSGILDPLRDIALAIWYLDGGGKTGRNRNNACLNLTRMSESAELIRDYFCVMDMFCSVNKSRSRIRLVFTVDGTERFLKTIAGTFPTFMYHRL